MTRVLILDEDLPHAEWLRNHLETEGYESTVAPTADDGLRCMHGTPPHLVILHDVEWIATVRRVSDVAIVWLAPSLPTQRAIANAFVHGADDYLAKPVSIRELRSRMLALLRRTQPPGRQGPSWVRVGHLELHPSSRSIRCDGETMRLPRLEYELLCALIRNRGRVVSRDELLRTVWQRSPAPSPRTIDTHVNSLRRKLERSPSCARCLFGVHRAGYSFLVATNG